MIFDVSGSGVQDVVARWGRIGKLVELASGAGAICPAVRWTGPGHDTSEAKAALITRKGYKMSHLGWSDLAAACYETLRDP